jgi:hypothetical protein
MPPSSVLAAAAGCSGANDVLEYRLCRACGVVRAGETHERPILFRNVCQCGGNWRILDEDEAAELFRLPAWQLTPHDIILCILAGIDPEVPEVR